jgi:hypothetical protein
VSRIPVGAHSAAETLSARKPLKRPVLRRCGRYSGQFVDFCRGAKRPDHSGKKATAMPSPGKRYTGVEGKTVECIETSREQQFVYLHISFTDKTALSISFTADAVLYHAALVDEAFGDQKVVRDYALPDRLR